MGTKLTDADKIGMSAEEIAVLEAENADDLLAMHGGAEGADGADANATGAEGGDNDADEANDAEDTTTAEQLSESEVVEDAPAKPAAAEPFKVEELDYAAERKKLTDEKSEIERRWAAGEEGCTDEWRAAELQRIDDARDDLLIRHTRAATLREQNEQAAARAKEAYESAIGAEVTKLLNASKKDGAAVAYAKDPKAQQQFDHYLRAVEGDPDAADLTPAQRVAEAHRLVLARRGIVAAAAPAPAPGAPTPPPRREVPMTLGGLPNAGRETQGNDILAELNSLTGEEYEKRLASLPAAQVEKLLRQADNAAATV